MDIEWAATKTTGSLGAAVMMAIRVPRLAIPKGRASYPRPIALQASESVEAIVKWFNAEKGFGFVTVAGGTDAFMHSRTLEIAGHSSVPEGARI